MSDPSNEQIQPVTRAELDVVLLEQEHRTFHVVYNLYRAWHWTSDDPRRKAAVTAFFWRILSPGAAAAAGVGLATILSALTYLELRNQNAIMLEQNRELRSANALASAQRKQEADSDRWLRERATTDLRLETIAILFEQGPNVRKREEALVRFVAMERLHSRRPDLSRLVLRNANLAGVDLQGVTLKDADLSYSILNQAKLNNADLRGALLARTDLQNASATHALFDKANFTSAKMWGADFTKASLKWAILDSAYIGEIKPDYRSVPGCHSKSLPCAQIPIVALFIEANLRNASLKHANLSHVDFADANLQDAILVGANAYLANFRGADFRSYGFKRGPPSLGFWAMDERFRDVVWALAVCPNGAKAENTCLGAASVLNGD